MALAYLVLALIYALGSCAEELDSKFDYAPDLQNIPSFRFSGFQLGQASSFSSQRSGNPSFDHQCDQVGAVPAHLTFITKYNYYRKYTHAYGIPIISSAYVSDAALKRACYVVRVLLADLPSVRYYLYKNFGRAGVIAANEGVRSIPEHSWLPAWWDQRARGLGGTLQYPISTGAEENLLCWNNDKYRTEDIFLHEFAHGIQEIAITSGAIPGWIGRLKTAYNYAKARGLWANTYAMSTWKEYFAEGVQSYFHVNSYANPPDGIHNDINTRSKLQRYDPTLYALIKELFPCGNYIKDRCDKSDNLVQMRMDCKEGGSSKPPPTTNTTAAPPVNGTTSPKTTKAATTAKSTPTSCVDTNPNCAYWASIGECNRNPGYMLVSCKKSCGKCNGGGGTSCTDSNQYCADWANRGECARNPGYMLLYCKKSCNVC